MNYKGKSIIMGSDSSHVPTGYGGVKMNICPYVRDLGLKVLEFGIQNTGNPYMVDGIEKLPNHRHSHFGAESMSEWIQERRPDLVWYIGDPHWFHWLSQMNKVLTTKDAKWYKSLVYFPIDNDVLPQEAVETLYAHDKRITFTNYGKRVCKEFGVDDVEVVPHGVDTETFKPLTDEQREDLKRKNNLNNLFIVGQVNRNNFRKNTPLLMAAFAEFAKNKPDARLFLHCDPQDPQGYNLLEYVKQFKLNGKILFNNKVKNPITGVPPSELNYYYNVMDVHASATTGEGWGLTTTEAQAAGVPVIIGDHTTGPELVKSNGWLVPCVGNQGWDSRIFTQQGGHYYRVSFDGMVEALEDVYADPEKRKRKGAAASKYIRGNYSWARVNQGWKKILDELED